MRSERLNRKSHFRRLAAKPHWHVGADIIDLESESEEFPLAALRQDEEVPHEDAENPHFRTAYDALSWCAKIIMQSPTARMLWIDAETHGWSVAFDDLDNQGFHIDADRQSITLDHFSLLPAALGRSAFFRNVTLTTLIRALRDAWHHSRAGDIQNALSPESILMIERARAADCDTTTILCGWELRGAGYADIWRHLLGSEEGDMAVVFTRFLERDPGSLFTGAALAYAFRQWYADVSRVDGTDHDTLEALDGMVESKENPLRFGKARADGAMLESLSMLPDGKCYLAGLGQGILNDPFFAGLNDSINQTHLFHLIYDMEVIMVNNVPFRDGVLARRIFPQGETAPVGTVD